MDFIAMKSIPKTREDRTREDFSDWVATEKVHGSSFQFFTSDGINIKVGSRRRVLDVKGTFLKCNIKNILSKYEVSIRRLWEIIASEERWKVYRSQEAFDNDDSDEDENNPGEDIDEEVGEDENGEDAKKDQMNEQADRITSEVNDNNTTLHVRIYGELYGGGGVKADIRTAVQKEIIYSDEFRFYVFGININRKWTTIAELNDLCSEAGFPYYAVPVCEPKPTLRELKEWLIETNFMSSKSRLTERRDDHKTFIEGVVMTPLTRKDFKLHAIKQLATAFSDVRAMPKKDKSGKTKINYCTKARYHSVISKLDIPEREQTDMVADMFIEDILKDSGDDQVCDKTKGIWRTVVIRWLTEDGYNGTLGSGKRKTDVTEEDPDDETDTFFDIFS